MTNDSSKPFDPKFPESDALSKSVDGAISILGVAANLVLPLSGGPAAALLKACVTTPAEVRRIQWLNDFAQAFYEQSQRLEDFDPQKLAENEVFVSAVVEITQIAMRTSHEDKRKMLRNALLNIAASYTMDEIVIGSYIAMIDRFSMAHIEVLRLYHNPRGLSSEFPTGNVSIHGPMKDYVGRIMAKKGVSSAALSKIHDDFERESLIKTWGLAGPPSSFRSLLSEMGEGFIAFIAKPDI